MGPKNGRERVRKLRERGQLTFLDLRGQGAVEQPTPVTPQVRSSYTPLELSCTDVPFVSSRLLQQKKSNNKDYNYVNIKFVTNLKDQIFMKIFH